MVAQLVEQRTENPRVVGSIPTLATIINPFSFNKLHKPLLYQLSYPAVILAVIRVRPELSGTVFPISIFPSRWGENRSVAPTESKRRTLNRSLTEWYPGPCHPRLQSLSEEGMIAA